MKMRSQVDGESRHYPIRKVRYAAGVGVPAGGALGVVIGYALASFFKVPEPIAAAGAEAIIESGIPEAVVGTITGLCGAAVSVFVAWKTRPGFDEKNKVAGA